MDLELAKKLLDCRRGSAQYMDGVERFLNFAFTNLEPDGKIPCPCLKCVNGSILDRESVRVHLVCNGMLRGYRNWVLHGEFVIKNVMNPSNYQCPAVGEPSNSHMHVDMDQLIHDAFGVVVENEPTLDSTDPMDSSVLIANLEAKNFYSLLKENDQALWEGCELTKLSLLVLLLHTKTTNKWTNKSFSDLLSVLRLAIPNGSSLPKSYAQVKKFLENLGLGYQKIHACPNNCQLYWKDAADDEFCSSCGVSRWKNVTETCSSTGRKKKKGIPAKVLRYFPLKPRLKRLFMCEKTASLFRWHEEERTKDGALRHPADSIAWKDFDSRHEHFSKDPRNVRFGLASDGFNPFGTLNSQYACWPIVLIPYNLPPWLCTKESYLFLSTLIPGPSGPGQKIDVYLQPLIEELKELWEVGMVTYDASLEESFTLHAAIMWTINDYPGYGYLSGYSVQGQFGCPHCNSETWSLWLRKGHKYCYMGHRRFLDSNHKYRYDKESFDGTVELRYAPVATTGSVVLSQIEEINNFKKSKTWKKKSIFFSLPYWETNLLRHNVDAMHTEKNVCENYFGTILTQHDKTKDNLNARHDLEILGIRKELHPEKRQGKSYYIPPACYAMTREEKKIFCKVLKDINVPDGYAGNISRCVNEAQCKLIGLKTHDCHILMQQLLPIAMRGLLPKNVTDVLFELSSCFRDLCAKVLYPDKLLQLEARIKLTLCHLEMIFPPGFFTIMVHLTIHLVQEAILGGTVHLRWMYPIERFLAVLKSYVRNRARPEGSIAEAYLAAECMTFCSRYIDGFDSKLNRPLRNSDKGQMNKSNSEPRFSMHSQQGRPLGKCGTYKLSTLERVQAHRYVLFNCPEVIPYLKEHAAEIKRKNRNRRLTVKEIERIQNEKFHDWFRDYVLRKEMDGSIGDMRGELVYLAKGPFEVARKYRGFNINGYKFRPVRYDKSTQSSGIVLVAKTSSYSHAKDRNPVLGDVTYYGRLKQIVELDYMGRFNVVLFKCDWVDVTLGRGVKKDDYGFALVNFSHLIHTGEKLEHEPFIFASQANQVFYVNDHLNPGWCIAIGVKPRDVYNMGDEEMLEDVEFEPYHAALVEDVAESLNQIQSWIRLGVEGTIVDDEEATPIVDDEEAASSRPSLD